MAGRSGAGLRAALILRDNGYRCDEAVLYYNATKQRVRVAMGEDVVTETLDALRRARAAAAAGIIPPPLVDSPKRPGCSLVGICLPDETRAAMAWRASEADTGTQLDLFAQGDTEETPHVVHEDIRRLVPARDDHRHAARARGNGGSLLLLEPLSPHYS